MAGGRYDVGDFMGDVIRDHQERRFVNAVENTIEGLKDQIDRAKDIIWDLKMDYMRAWATYAALAYTLKDIDPENAVLGVDFKEQKLDALLDAAASECGLDRGKMTTAANKIALDHYKEKYGAANSKRSLKSREEASAAYRAAYVGALKDISDHRAEKVAYREVLRSIDPSHPLLNRREIRDRLRRGAQLSFDFEDDPKNKWKALDATAAAFIAEEFSEPPVTVSKFEQMKLMFETQRSLLLEKLPTLEADLCDHRAQKVVFRSELARISTQHPLVVDAKLRKGISDAAGKAFAFAPSGTKYEALDMAALDYFNAYVRKQEQPNAAFLAAGFVRADNPPSHDARAKHADASLEEVSSDGSHAPEPDPHDTVLREQERRSGATDLGLQLQPGAAGPKGTGISQK